MLTVLISVGAGKLAHGPEAQLVEEFRKRAGRYEPCRLGTFRDEAQLLQAAAQARRQRPLRLVLLDARGDLLSSERLADRLGQLRDGRVQELWMAVGPPDGWRPDTLAQADLRLSFGPMTLPHRLALVVLAEQVYRAWTILAGHPYHSGH